MSKAKKISRSPKKTRAKTCKPATEPALAAPAQPQVKVGDMVLLKPWSTPYRGHSWYDNNLNKIVPVSSVTFEGGICFYDREADCDYYWSTHYEPVTEYKPTPPESSPVLDATLPMLYENLAICGGDEAKLKDTLIDSYKRIGDGLATGLDIKPDMAYGVPITALAAFQAAAVVYLKKIGYKAK